MSLQFRRSVVVRMQASSKWLVMAPVLTVICVTCLLAFTAGAQAEKGGKGNGGPPPDAIRVRELTTAAIPDLDPGAVRVFVSTTTPATDDMVDLGPFQVTAASAGRARGVLGGLLALCLVLAGGLVFAGVRLRRLRRGPQS